MKVALLIREFTMGGAQRQLALLARGLRRHGHGVTVLTMSRRSPLWDELQAEGIAAIDLDKRGTYDVIGPLRRLSAHIAAESPDVVYSFLGFANVAAALAMPKRTATRLVWGARVSERPGLSYGVNGALLDFAETRLIRRPDMIIANSQAASDWMMRRGAAPEKCRVVPNGFEPSRFVIDPDRRGRQRAAWGVADGAPVIGIVARFDPMKDHATFFRAAARLAARRPDLRVVVVGESPGETGGGLARLAARNGMGDGVIWCSAGHDGIAEIYNGLDVLCLTSVHSEGFPNVLAEAMLCGVACVATDVGDARHILGGLGQVVAPRDAEACEAAINRALVNGRNNRLPAARRNRIVKLFSATSMVEATEAALMELVPAEAGVTSRISGAR